MKIFYGAAIQGNFDRSKRDEIHEGIITHLNNSGCHVVSEHTKGSNFDETANLLTRALGPLPKRGIKRTEFVRNKMIELLEGDIDACVFEVSIPSLGTGIEIAHAYLRPRLGLSEIPILALYEKRSWPHGSSSMVRGLSAEKFPNFFYKEYATLADAYKIVDRFIEQSNDICQ
jgi:hypothetical protein